MDLQIVVDCIRYGIIIFYSHYQNGLFKVSTNEIEAGLIWWLSKAFLNECEGRTWPTKKWLTRTKNSQTSTKEGARKSINEKLNEKPKTAVKIITWGI